MYTYKYTSFVPSETYMQSYYFQSSNLIGLVDTTMNQQLYT